MYLTFHGDLSRFRHLRRQMQRSGIIVRGAGGDVSHNGTERLRQLHQTADDFIQRAVASAADNAVYSGSAGSRDLCGIAPRLCNMDRYMIPFFDEAVHDIRDFILYCGFSRMRIADIKKFFHRSPSV